MDKVINIEMLLGINPEEFERELRIVDKKALPAIRERLRNLRGIFIRESSRR